MSSKNCEAPQQDATVTAYRHALTVPRSPSRVAAAVFGGQLVERCLEIRRQAELHRTATRALEAWPR